MKSALSAWLPVALCAALIWGLGSDSFSHSETSRFLAPLLRWMLPDLPDESLATLLSWIRKSMHPAEYGLLAGLAWRGGSMTWRGATLRRAGVALALAAALASADELRQSLSPARTGSAADSLLDVAGATAVLLALFAIERWRGRPLFEAHARPSTSESPLDGTR